MKSIAYQARDACAGPCLYVSIVFFLLLWAVAEPAAQGQAPGNEDRVKAAFLYHFAQLVDWPLGLQEEQDHSLLLCTLGDDPLHGALEELIEGKAIGTRIIHIRHLKYPESMPACQVLFLGKEQTGRIPVLLAALHHAPVLTVGETEGFLGSGGMICFLLKENKLRFAINLGAAEAARLKIGSRLLVLADNLAQENRGR